MVESSSSLLWATILVALVVITIGHVEGRYHHHHSDFNVLFDFNISISITTQIYDLYLSIMMTMFNL